MLAWIRKWIPRQTRRQGRELQTRQRQRQQGYSWANAQLTRGELTPEGAERMVSEDYKDAKPFAQGVILAARDARRGL